jgi:DNA-binding response OmpR family regulator
MRPFLHEVTTENVTRMSRTCRIELTLDELTAIQYALARVSAEEVATRLGRPPGDTGPLVSSLLSKTAAALSTRLQDQPVVMLDDVSHAVTILGDRLACKPTSFRLLSYLIHRQGSWVRSGSLQREVLQTSAHDGASNIRWHVLQVRRSLGLRAGLLHSDNRLGFMFDLTLCDRRHCAARRNRPANATTTR